jgi:hypothetical protein
VISQGPSAGTIGLLTLTLRMVMQDFLSAIRAGKGDAYRVPLLGFFDSASQIFHEFRQWVFQRD